MLLAQCSALVAAIALFWPQETVERIDNGTRLQDVVRFIRDSRDGREGRRESVRVFELAAGTYVLERPLVLGPEASAVHWRAAPGASVTWSGGRRVDRWRLEEDGSWSAAAPATRIRQLFVDGVRRPCARWPREGWLRVARPGSDGRTSFHFRENDLFAWPDTSSTELVFLHDWSTSRLRIASIDPELRRVSMAEAIGGYLPFFHITGFEEHPRYALENVRAGWTQPGEWYVDRAAQRLRYRPMPGEEPRRTEVIVPVLETLLELRGEASRKLERVSFEGITFAHTRSMDPPGGYAGIQAAFHDQRSGTEATGELPPSSAVQASYVDDLTFERCRFEKLGGSALWLGTGVRKARVVESTFSDVGANGLMIGAPGDPERPDALTAGVVCEDSLVEHCGQLYHGAVGIWVGIAKDVAIRHNELRELPYTGISLGWIWDPRESASGRHRIERNHIHHVMQTLSDGGGIYTLGRQPETFVRNNLIHDVPANAGKAQSNGIFVDQGSNGIVFEGNVLHSIVRSPIRFHLAGANTLTENVLVTTPGCAPFRYDSCSAESMTFEGNRLIDPATWEAPTPATLAVGRRQRSATRGTGN